MYLPYTLDDGAFPPSRAHADDAGADLRTPVPVIVYPHMSASIDTGVHVGIPRGFAGLLVAKSGLNVRNDVTSTGLIDAGYTGSIVVRLHNHGKKPLVLSRGDKVTQLVVLPVLCCDFTAVDELDDTERGDAGFGSTGR